MMRMIVVYDDAGYIISLISGDGGIEPREPIGVPFLWVDVPGGKRIKITDGIGVDVSVTPHQVILEDIPPTEIELLKKQNVIQKQQVDSISSDLQAFMDFYFENGGV